MDAFSNLDDIYCPPFGRSLVPQIDGESPDTSLPEELESSLIFDSVFISGIKRDTAANPCGPYFLRGQRLHQASRLYSDELDAFIARVIPKQVLIQLSSYKLPWEKDVRMTFLRFHPVEFLSPNSIWRQIAVPSRPYHETSDAKPLAGICVSIKDGFNVAGIQNTMMSRAYTELYASQDETFEYVKLLNSVGSVVVGKTKMSSAGSSTGAAASLAVYSWLDHSIGADRMSFVTRLVKVSANLSGDWKRWSTRGPQWALRSAGFYERRISAGCHNHKPLKKSVKISSPAQS